MDDLEYYNSHVNVPESDRKTSAQYYVAMLFALVVIGILVFIIYSLIPKKATFTEPPVPENIFKKPIKRNHLPLINMRS